MTRRRRLLWITGAFAALFLGAAGVAAWRWQRPGPVYMPGEHVEGLTSELARGLPADYPRVVFTDMTRQAGITFQHFSGRRSSQLPEDMGSGAAWGDFDGDGFVDLAVANEVGPLTMSDAERRTSPARATLYRNNGDGTFTDVTERSRIESRTLGMGVAWGDYDNDGRIDLVITSYGTNALYHNDGDGVFSNRTDPAGIGAAHGFWTGASWGDYDRDGFVDLYITGYVKYRLLGRSPTGTYDVENPATINPASFAPERNLLYRNNRDGTFTEVAFEAGVADTTGRGMSAAWTDFDEDGWLDLYVANDQSDNAFFRNLGNGKFEDISHSARVADYRSAMGIAVGDWNGDGLQDVFLTHWIAQENALYTSKLTRGRSDSGARRLTFMDEADRYGLGQVSLDFVGWATSFIDYDNDSKPDLFVVNGSTLQSRSDSTRLVPMRNQLFWNRGQPLGFFEVSSIAGEHFREERVGRGGAFADYDNDGDVDAFVVNHGGPGILLRNDGGNRNRWLQVEARGTRSNRQAIGVTMRVVAAGVSQERQVGAQPSYMSQNDLVETFGLGSATRAETLVVQWPGGATVVRTDVESNQRLIIAEPKAGAPDRVSLQTFWQLYRDATAHRTARRNDAAIAAYEGARAINADHEDVLYYLGGLRLEQGDYAAAGRAWRHLVAVNPASARGHSQLGVLHACLDAGAPFDLDSAEYHLRRAHEINKEENGPLVRLGEVALLRGDLAEARRHFDLVLVTHADNALARFYSAYLAWKAGDATHARAEFDRAGASESAGTAPAAVVGEGDTKRGRSPLTASETRCRQLRSLAERARASDVERDLATRFHELEALTTRRKPK